MAALDLPLVEIGVAPPAAPEPPQEGTGGASAESTPAPAVLPSKDPPAEEVAVAAPAEPETAPATESIASTVPEEDVVSAEETAERFVS